MLRSYTPTSNRYVRHERSFSFQAHTIGTMVLSGPLVYPLDQAAEALRHYRDFMATAPDELTVMAVFTSVPPMAPYQRLQAIKQQYDPQNIFCSNQNILPVSS